MCAFAEPVEQSSNGNNKSAQPSGGGVRGRGVGGGVAASGGPPRAVGCVEEAAPSAVRIPRTAVWLRKTAAGKMDHGQWI